MKINYAAVNNWFKGANICLVREVINKVAVYVLVWKKFEPFDVEKDPDSAPFFKNTLVINYIFSLKASITRITENE